MSSARYRALLPLLLAASLPACGWLKPNQPAAKEEAAERNEALAKRVARACASETTYQRLKDLAFEEAREVHNAQSPLLDRLASVAVLRMEEPVVLSRDEELNVTACRGRMVLELPPGTERAFGGRRRLSAEVEYAAQSAADESGMIYQMTGAEPIVYRLAAFELSQRGGAPAAAPAASARTEEIRTAEADFAAAPAPIAPEPAPVPSAAPTPPPAAPPRPAPAVEPSTRRAQAPTFPAEPPARRAEAPVRRPEALPVRAASARPSFNCRYARTRGERMVCGSPDLASLDRRMASTYYATVAAADPATKAELRRSREAFLRARDRCGGEACVAESYRARIAEIRGYGLAD